MCKSHLRFLLWIVTPNTLWASTDSKALVSMAKADGRWSTTLWKHSHLLALFGVKNHIVCSSPSADVVKCRLQNWHPACCCKFCYMMSSTYFQYEQRGEANFKSLIIITKSIGPSLVPWGTPARTGSQLESVCPSLTRGHRSVGKRQIHDMLQRCTPKSISLLLMMVWSILSNTLLKWRKRALK